MRASVYLKNELERVELPERICAVGFRRCRPIMQHYSRMAGVIGQLDLEALTLSCYMQGLHDALDLAKNHPEAAARCLENV